MKRLSRWPGLTGLLLLPCLGGAAAPLSGTYVLGPTSELSYTVVHPLHHATGVTHALAGRVAVAAEKLVTPLTLTLPLLSFHSGNANRDANAAFTLGVDRFPLARLEVARFDETSHTLDAAGLRHIAGLAHGQLTLHGATHALDVPLQAVLSPQGLTVDGHFAVSLTAYGIDRPSLLFKPIDDAVEVIVHAVAQPQTP